MILEPRSTGIAAVGDIPCGTHFCHFYETKEDLVDILIPFFRAGLERNEFCMWIPGDPLTEKEARELFRRGIPEGDKYLESGAIEIVPHFDWYLSQGILDLKQATDGLNRKLEWALSKGYSGMRANANEDWVTRKQWDAFASYEHELNDLIAGRPMIILCTYPLRVTTARELFDVVRTHQFAVARNRGAWEIFETPELLQAKQELRKLNAELEQRVSERTLALAQANQKLRSEIAARQRLSEKLRESEQQFRALSARLQSAREEEGRRIAREIHDELGSSLTTLKWELEGIAKELTAHRGEPSPEPLRRQACVMVTLVDAMIDSVRRIASELRPSILDDLGIVEAIEWLAQQFQGRTGIVCRCELPRTCAGLSGAETTAAFRIFQEALTNVLRHAQATEVGVSVKQDGRDFVLTVRDNGKGFVESEAPDKPSLGLLGMRERARLVGGNISFESAEGDGTTITLRIPIGATK